MSAKTDEEVRKLLDKCPTLAEYLQMLQEIATNHGDQLRVTRQAYHGEVAAAPHPSVRQIAIPQGKKRKIEHWKTYLRDGEYLLGDNVVLI